MIGKPSFSFSIFNFFRATISAAQGGREREWRKWRWLREREGGRERGRGEGGRERGSGELMSE